MEQAVLQELAEVQEHQVQAEQVVLQEHRELAEAQELQVQAERQVLVEQVVLRELQDQAVHQVLAERQVLVDQAVHQVLAEVQELAEQVVHQVMKVTTGQIAEDGNGKEQALMQTLERTTL